MGNGTGRGWRGRWAARTEVGGERNALAEALLEARSAGVRLLDLTVSNPTRCGFLYDEERILRGLGSPVGLRYDADPLGMRAARRAVCEGYYAARGVTVLPERLMLTASTSEAYGYLLRLLCEAGDEVLVPEPSYPLFDLLGRMNDVALRAYPLRLHDGWRVDWEALRGAVTERTRAIVVVHPNNPTGHTVDAEERKRFEAVAEEFGLVLIADEVFLDFGVERTEPVRSFAGCVSPVLTFVLSGLSKVLALPQMKLAWTVVGGPEDACNEAMARLELIADTFLSVNGPVQGALAEWLPAAEDMQGQIQGRVRGNLEVLDGLLRAGRCGRLPVEAGWSVVLRVPAVLEDESMAVRLVREAGVVVHPGSFYGLPGRGWLVLSLLTPPTEFERGVTDLLQGIEAIVTEESGT